MEQKHRSEFPEKELWDLTALYQDREDFLRAIEKAREDINQFSRDYKGNLHTFEDFEKAFAELEQIYIQMSHIGNYGFMPQTTDYSLSLIHISEPTRPRFGSRMPSSA